MSYKYETLIKLDQHVNEMMATAGKKFQNFLWSRFLIIVQNVNIVANGKRNRRLNPCECLNCDLSIVVMCRACVKRIVHGCLIPDNPRTQFTLDKAPPPTFS